MKTQSERSVQKCLFAWDGVGGGACSYVCLYSMCDWWEMAVSVCDTQVCFKSQHTGICFSFFFSCLPVSITNKSFWYLQSPLK